MLAPRDTPTRQIKSLSGLWRFCLDAAGEGRTAGWSNGLPAGSREMPVPASYNDVYPEAEFRDHVGDAWYETTVHVPSTWSDERIVLRFGSATHRAVVWVNGTQVATHEGGYTPFEADATDVVKHGAENLITVVVNNELTWQSIPPGYVEQTPDGPRQKYFHDFFNYAGLHRAVVLYTTPPAYVSDVTVVTGVDGKVGIVRFEIETANAEGLEVRVTLRDTDGVEVATAIGPSGELALAIEIPPGFGRQLDRGQQPEVGMWIDGAMPLRAETIKSYTQAMHSATVSDWVLNKTGARPQMPSHGEVRFRYNPELRSLVAMVPAVIPMLLVFIPAMLMALGVVREKELGSIMNLYTTPVTKLEFLLGKQLPYVVLAMISFVFLFLLAITLFRVPFTGSFFTLLFATLLYVTATTGLGLLASTLTNSQVAALSGTAIGTLMPAIQFAGMVDPVSSLQGLGAFIGEIYPTSHYLTISRGTFSKALHFSDLRYSFYPLIIAIPLLTMLSVFLLKKQAK